MQTLTPLSDLATKRALLIGQPNVGKSVLFHALTGKYATVSNFPGTTVEIAYSMVRAGEQHWDVFDTPGVVSLPPRTEDEAVTRDAILELKPDIIIQVADAKDLARSVHLTLEIAEYNVPMILVLNMSDEARDRGISIDMKRLSSLLGIPVVETIAVTGEGLGELKKQLAQARRVTLRPEYDAEFLKALEETENSASLCEHPFRRAVAMSLLLKDSSVENYLEKMLGAAQSCEMCQQVQLKAAPFSRPPELIGFTGKQRVVAALIEQVWSKQDPGGHSLWTRLGLWCVQPMPGYLIALFILFLLYQFVGVFGAQTLVGFLEENVFGNHFNPWIAGVVERFIPVPFVRDFLVGEYGIFTMALTYALALILPIVTTFFIFFGILEDSGYLPRLAVMLDRLFRFFGLNGKAVLPMVLGLGCGTMATVTTRILGSTKEKIIVSLLLTLAVPCSAQLGVIFGMAAGVSLPVFLIWFSLITLSVMLVGWGASRALPGVPAPFLIQLPPMRIPKMSNIFRKVFSRLYWYSMEVIPLFLIATSALFVLDAFHLLQWIEKMMSPVLVHWLGLPAKTAEAFLIGFLRRDYGAAGLYDLQMQGLLSPLQVLISMVMVTLFMPCVAHLLVTVKERGWRVTGMIFLFVLAYALAIGGAIRFVFRLWPVI